ncbi:MAG: YdcF family protein [Oscillospiraceae bacterium]
MSRIWRQGCKERGLTVQPFDCFTDFIFVEHELIPCQYALVPGGSHPQLAEKAAALLRNGMVQFVLFSGGVNAKLPDEPSEAEYLKKLAVRYGANPDSILCETKAQNTYENALFSFNMLKERTEPFQRMILVCKAYHSRRALFTYQKAFPAGTEFLVAPVTDQRGITRENWHTKPDYIKVVMNETVKMGSYFHDSVLNMSDTAVFNQS